MLWTLLNSGHGLLGGIPIARRVIICCPTSLVSNWDSECVKFLKVGGQRVALCFRLGGSKGPDKVGLLCVCLVWSQVWQHHVRPTKVEQASIKPLGRPLTASAIEEGGYSEETG